MSLAINYTTKWLHTKCEPKIKLLSTALCVKKWSYIYIYTNLKSHGSFELALDNTERKMCNIIFTFGVDMHVCSSFNLVDRKVLTTVKVKIYLF